jgi:inhibitor of the pro-sigma K processing machinery
MVNDIGVFLTYVGAVIMIFIFGKLFLWPIKIVLKLVFNSILGGAIIMLINHFGSEFGVFIPLNFITSVVVGILGLPGAILLLVLNL